MAVEAVDECLDGGLVEVPQVGGGLAWLLAQHHCLGADEAERINHHLQKQVHANAGIVNILTCAMAVNDIE